MKFRYPSRELSKVLSELGGQVCLLGGWAVYLTVNENFRASEGRNFMGSRDIDLGFHVDQRLDRFGAQRLGLRQDHNENRTGRIQAAQLPVREALPHGD